MMFNIMSNVFRWKIGPVSQPAQNAPQVPSQYIERECRNLFDTLPVAPLEAVNQIDVLELL